MTHADMMNVREDTACDKKQMCPSRHCSQYTQKLSAKMGVKHKI